MGIFKWKKIDYGNIFVCHFSVGMNELYTIKMLFADHFGYIPHKICKGMGYCVDPDQSTSLIELKHIVKELGYRDEQMERATIH